MAIETEELNASHGQHPPCQFPCLGERQLEHDYSHEKLEIPMGILLQEACKRYHTTIELALAAIWAITLKQFTADDRAGFLITHPVAGDNVGKRSLVEYVHEAYSTSITGEILVGELMKPSAWRRSPYIPETHLFNTSVRIEKAETDNDFMESKQIKKPLQISLTLRNLGRAPTLSLRFNPQYLPRTFATVLASSLHQCSQEIMSHCHARVGEINLFSAMQQQIVSQWQRVPCVPNTFNFMFEAIFNHVKQRPLAVAVDAWDGRWSYRELDAASSRLAGHLQGKGIRPGAFVPICFDKTCWAVVAMLAINKAGAAFVALDPSYPVERRERIIRKVGATLVLTTEQHVNLFTPSVDLDLICVSAATIASSSGAAYMQPANNETPGYVLFTSGSTGEPKGCEVSHKAFASLVNQTDALYLNPGSRTLQFASYSFGMSIIEIFCTLVVGGTVCIPSADQRLNSLGPTMTSMRVNWAVLTPTVLASLRPSKLPHLRFVLLGGEPMNESQVHQWTSKVDMRYGYGLTEWSGTLTVSDRITVGPSSQPTTIGRPINAHAWLVNPTNPDQLVPIGAPGELIIKGPSLAHGYLYDPVRTEKSFLPGLSWLSEWNTQPGQLYRTGDIMRYREDGSLVYLYRKDNQIKIRGLRVELGDIESHLTELVEGAKRVPVVVCRPQDSSDLQVLAALILLPKCEQLHPIPLVKGAADFMFVQLPPEGVEELQHAQNSLRKRLPEYMIPQFLLPMVALPTTASGKIDRRRIGTLLDQLTIQELKLAAGMHVENRLPANEDERLVQKLTCEILGITSASMEDNFFHLAGDSVSAMKLAGLARHHNFKLTVKDIFEAPVLTDLATRLVPMTESTVLRDPFGLLHNAVRSDIITEAADQAQLNCGQITDAYPSSPLQEGLCALSMKDPSSYKARVVCRLRPDTNIKAFQAAWEQTFQANDILRTRFIASSTHGTIQAVVEEQFEWDQADDLGNYILGIEQEPMGLGKKLVRACLLKDQTCAEMGPTFVLTLHHGLCDRWSTRQLLEQIDQRVGAAPEAVSQERIAFWPFIQHISGINPHSAEYWIKQFEGIEAVTFPELPAPDFTPVANHAIDYAINLPTRVLREITIASHIRLAWAIIIATNTSLEDVVYGATVNGRGAQVNGIETLTGPTIATVPIRTRLEPGATVADSLANIQLQSIEMLPWEQAGLQNIQKYSPEAEVACSFQSHLTIQPAWGRHPTVFADCKEGAAVSGGFASYALNIECYLNDDESQMEAKVAFDARVIHSDRVHRLLEHLQVILTEIISRPQEKLSSISHISPSDMAWLMEQNKRVPERPKDLVHEVVRENAHKSAERPAVSSFDGALTFAELERHATQLASELVLQGVGPGMLLPVLFEKSRWVIVAMLAVLKVGCAIVPLDSSYAVERIRAICTQVESPLVLCSNQMVRIVEEIQLNPVVVAATSNCFKRPTREISLPAIEIGSDAAFYMIFTSGSTGAPKGLIINHGAFCASARSYIPELQLDTTSRVLQFCSFAFDICFLEIFATLLAGACICVPSEDQRTNDIHHAMRERKVSHAIITPSYARVIRVEEVPSLRTVMLAGEALLASDVEYWAPRVRLLNGYGPAECSPLSAVQYNNGNSRLHPRDIGFPQGCVAWISDPRDYNILKPIGATGELIIEGPNVGLGYFKNPSETESAFIQPRWLQAHRGSACRAYRTGDLVCYTHDGRLRYMGRMGQQVKLRGQRLDPSHVENQLLQSFSGSAEVAVVVASPSDARDRATLAGFVLLEREANPQSKDRLCGLPTEDFTRRASTARSNLHQTLPAYMVPTLMIPVLFMPRTASGKLDRRALEREITQRKWTELSMYESLDENAPNRAPLDAEQKLQCIWATVLGLSTEDVRLNQSFFALGGDSITAMLVVAQARSSQVGLNIAVEDIFRYRTIENIVAHAAQGATNQRELVCHDSLDTPFDLTPIQRLFFDVNRNQGFNRFNHNLLVRLKQRISYDQLKFAMKTIVQAHPMLRARFVPGSRNEHWKQQIPSTLEGSFRCAWHFDRSIASVRAESHHSLSITLGPVFSGDLIETKESQSILLAAHHLVVDLVSWTVILNDLEQVLRGAQISGASSTSFQTWSKLLAEYQRGLQGESDLTPTDPLPWKGLENFWAFAIEENTYGNSEDTTTEIDQRTTDLLLGDVNKTFGTQPVELLHAAIFFAFIQAFPDRPPPTTYSEGHGREPWDASVDLTRTVGWFTTMAPIMVKASNMTQFSDVVGQVKSARRRLPRNGLDTFTARQPSSPMEIVFNYGGRYTQQLVKDGSWFQVESFDSMGIFDSAPEVRRWSVVDINSIVQDGKLTLSFTHPRGRRQSEIITEWVSNLKKALERLATGFYSSNQVYIPMDFPLLNADDARLQSVVVSVSKFKLPSRIENVYPCSPIQRGILLSQAKNPSHYHVAMVWEIHPASDEPPSLDRAKAAVEQVISCHPSLRTMFVKSVSEDSVYDQVVMSEPWSPIEEFIGQDKAMQSTRLTPECPSRFTIHSAFNRVYIRLDITHALVDAHSLNIIQRDLRLAYDGQMGYTKGPDYADFIAYLQTLDSEQDRSFWEKELEGAQPCLFPSLTDHKPRELDQNKSYTHELQHLEQLYSYCRSHQVTPANIFCLAWSLVLRAYVGSDDVCFGVLASGRELPFDGAADVVGPLINMLTVRLHLSSGSTVRELLQHVHAKYLAYLRHQTYSTADISRRKGEATHFNTAVSIQRIMPADNGSSSTTLNLAHREDPAEYAIAVNIDIEPTRIVMHLRYWLSALSSQQASLISSAFGRAVQQIITNDHLAPTELDLLSAQHQGLIHQWNNTLPAFDEALVHETIQRRVEATPDAVAVRWSKGMFTYRELSAISDRLCIHLTSHGVGSGSLVPLCFDKSPWTVVALLAVIKSHAGFALFDVTHPDSRLLSISNDLQSNIILCSRDQEARCKKLGKTVIVVGEGRNSWHAGASNGKPKLADMSSRNPLFVVYTSGSTGKPKGVVIEHRSFCACVYHQIPIWGMTPSAHVLQFASYAFDASVFEILFPLMTGATTCILTEVERRDYLEVTMKRLRVTHAFLTPSVARQISPAALRDFEVLVCGGEPLTHIDIAQWSGNVRFVETYGPAECTVFSTDQPHLTTSSRPSDIGRPVAPVGGLGEILIEGPIVSRGYINNPAATDAAFIPPPGWLRALRADLDPMVRLYKTGDLARYYPDGRIDFHGRKDSQIKIRGQRIELGEVEFQVKVCFQSARGIVVDVAYTGPKRTPGLFAFIWVDRDMSSLQLDATPIMAADEEFQAQAVTASTTLFERLPAYMVPSYFIPLATLPMNSSGKADRKYLKSLLDMSADHLNHYRPFSKKKTAQLPSTPGECLLHQIWASALGLDTDLLGVDDNFFQIGGDSVTAMKVAAVARRQGLEISVADIFARPKLSDLAATAGRTDNVERFSPTAFSLCPPDARDLLPALLHARNTLPPETTIADILPVSAGQAFFLKRPTLHHFTFDIEGDVNVDRMRNACEAVYQFLDILRTIFIQWRGQLLQLILANPPVPFHHIVTDSDPLEANRELREIDRISASLYDDQPPCSFILISHRDATRHSLIFRLSHAQWDGLSLGELFSAFGDAYHSRILQPTTSLTTVVYDRLMRDKSESVSFWRKYLQGSTMSALIPHVSEKTDLKPGTTIWENTTLNPAPHAPPGITMATVVKAAWALIIAEETGSRDIVFGQTVNGRSSALPNIERIFGCCLNFTPVRIRLADENGSISELLRYTQEQYQQTVAHDDMDIKTVIDECTEWGEETYINSIVQHQNIPLHHMMPLEDLKTEFTLHGYFRPGREVVIFTEPAGDVLSVQFCANPNVICLEEAKRLHGRLVELIVRLCEEGNQSVAVVLKR
ncbi:hypothetical protein BJX99DRAFT_264600 [Aspergillus californicus]